MRIKIGLLLVSFVLALFFAATASALDLGHEITIYDNERNASKSWWDRGISPGEDEEVEPGNLTGQQWDLEGFFLNGTKLAIVGGFDFINGVGGFDSGDIFIDVNGDAVYGVDAFGLDNLSGNGVQTISNSYGYDYVIDLHPGLRTYDAYSLDETSQLKSVYYRSNDGANPWQYIVDEDNKLNEAPEQLTYMCLDTLEGFVGSSHNVLIVDLGILGDVIDAGFLAHFTIGCGNDNLMGANAPVPEPATMLLLGAGLIGLARFGRRRFKKGERKKQLIADS